MNTPIAIAFSTDDNYAPYTSTAIFSLIKNRDRQKAYSVFVFYTCLSQANISLLSMLQTDNVSIHFVNIESYLGEYNDLFYTRAHYSKESYYRFFMPGCLGKAFDYVVYLDDDLIVNCDISNILFKIDRNKTINGVLNYSTQRVSRRLQTLNLSYKSYINAGVLVINCKRFEKLGYFSKAMECIANHRNLACIDQDVLNIICKGDIGLLEPSWNIQWHNLNNLPNLEVDIVKLISNLPNPRIIHYTSDKKPWNCSLNSYGDFYVKYASQNPIYKRFF